MFKVRASVEDAKRIVEEFNGFTYNREPVESTLKKLAEEVLEDRGYPSSTEILFDAEWDQVEMTLVVSSDGSWELV